MKLSAFMDAVFVSSNTFFLAACLLTKHNLFLSQLFNPFSREFKVQRGQLLEKLFINVQCRLKLGVQTRNKLLSSSKLNVSYKSPLLSSGCASFRRNHLGLVSWHQLAQPRLWSPDGRSHRKLQNTQLTGNKMVPQEDHTGMFCAKVAVFCIVYCFYKGSLSNQRQRFVLIINRFQ